MLIALQGAVSQVISGMSSRRNVINTPSTIMPSNIKNVPRNSQINLSAQEIE